MAETQLWTYQDVVEHLTDAFDVDLTGRYQRIFRRAAQNAYRDLPSRHNWNVLQSRQVLRLEPAQSTGTVTYQHSTRRLTLSGATWPQSADRYRVRIGLEQYSIESHVSSTVVVLPVNSNPGQNIATPAQYQAWRDAYPLPIDFKELWGVFDATFRRPLHRVTSQEVHFASAAVYIAPARPNWFTIRNVGEYYNSLSIEFIPPPLQAAAIDILYKRGGRDLLIERASTGTVTTDGSTTVAGSGTDWTDRMIGSVMRFSGSTTQEPTGLVGGIAGDDNPAVHQRIVMAVNSATELVVDSDVPELTGVRYTISDPVDFEIPSMFTAYLRLCEAEAALMLNKADALAKRAVADRAIREAIEADSRTPALWGKFYRDDMRASIIQPPEQ